VSPSSVWSFTASNNSDTEIDALLTAALTLPPEDGLRRWTYHTPLISP
jgi:hypothetical protein